MTTKRCRCCGDPCGPAEAARSTDPEWSTCRACGDAGCAGVPGTDGDQRRGASCPLVVTAGEDGADAVLHGTALDVSTNNWTIKDIRVGNAAQPSGEAPKDEPTGYHFPRLKRTIMGGPGNRSSIIDCSCGARFDGVYEYLGHDRRMCDWYARHAGITGGGDAVARILRQYDAALDAVDFPDHPRTRGKRLPGTARREAQPRGDQSAAIADLNSVGPEGVLDRLRTEFEDVEGR